MLLRITSFSGVVPRLSPRLLAPGQAQTAENVKLWSGVLEPWKVPGNNVTLPKTGPLMSVYLFRQQYWFHWTTDVDVVESPIANNINERTYFTGDGLAKMTDDTIALAGGTLYPMNSTLLGIPRPSTAPTHDNPAPSDANTVKSRAYVYTWVRSWNGIDEETSPSDPSAISSVTPGDTVTITTPVAPPSGNYTPTGATWKKRLYRANTGSTATAYQFLVELAVTTANYADTTLSEDLDEILPSTDWDTPPDDMIGIVEMPNGIIVGFRKNEICPSVAYQFHAYPILYRQSTKRAIVGIKVFGNSALVTTLEYPYLLTGVDPSAMSLEKIELQQACSNKRSMVDMGPYVIYASPDGLVGVGPGIARVMTENFFTKDEWTALVPASIIGFHYDGRYYGFYDTGTVQGGFIFDPSESRSTFTFLNVNYDCGYNDVEFDKLYLVSGQTLAEWDTGSTNLQMNWKGGVMVAGQPTNPAGAQVIGDHDVTNPVTFRLYADTNLVHTETVTDNLPFPLPSNYLATDFEVDLTATTKINEVLVANSAREFRKG